MEVGLPGVLQVTQESWKVGGCVQQNGKWEGAQVAESSPR